MDKEHEIELARSLLAGKNGAFETFVEHFRSKVFHYSWLMCGSREDAEEVAQETLLKVFENIGQLREPEKVRAWVFRIAKNACLMQRRRSIFAPTQLLPLDELDTPVEDAGDDGAALGGLLQSELRTVLERAIAELPPVYRAVVVLRDLEELSTEETGQILDLSTDVVKTRLHRGRVSLRQTLDCYLNERCLEDQPAPNPKPLSAAEKQELYAAWHGPAEHQASDVSH